MTQQTLTSDKILAATRIPFYRLEYLVRIGAVPCEKNGKGTPRNYPPDAVDLIRKILGATKKDKNNDSQQKQSESVHGDPFVNMAQ